MKFAIPLSQDRLGVHFGHCEKFALVEVDAQSRQITATLTLVPPPHEPGVLPRWLNDLGADVIIAGGMGAHAKQLFEKNDIKVIIGAPCKTPDDLVLAYLDGTLESGPNVCDH